MAETSVFCPNCDAENSLSYFTYDREIEYGGKTIIVKGLEGSQCDKCGSDPVLERQARRNQARYADSKRKADGLLTGEEIANIRKSLKLTQEEAATVFGGGLKAFSKYERGDVTQSASMDHLIRIAIELPGAENWLRAHAGLPSKQIRNQGYGEFSSKVVDLAEHRRTLLGVSTVPDGPYEQQG